ncbi:hypothetical protein B1F73_20950 [Pseudomonas syringae]|nr:hypothetical protein CCL12_03315 [Pseudomonas syringae]PBP87741.1 hypothetical protein CCL20_12265 [Pseudomonas syringae]QNR43014.1 hypothetical protein D5S12_17455 [Pseudomonas syringae]RXT77851.1 hypothetical protein B1F77_09020 [Pseudomonas syringae]RXT87900.1 hypothetical protein B1F72_01220 [Pseudomonas syringae]
MLAGGRGSKLVHEGGCGIRWIQVRLGFSFLTLRVGMQFVTLCVTQQFFFVRRIEVRLRSPFRPSATHFEGPT